MTQCPLFGSDAERPAMLCAPSGRLTPPQAGGTAGALLPAMPVLRPDTNDAAAAAAAAPAAAAAASVIKMPSPAAALAAAAQAAQQDMTDSQRQEMRWLAWRKANGLPTDYKTPAPQQHNAALADEQQPLLQQPWAQAQEAARSFHMMPMSQLPPQGQHSGGAASGTQQDGALLLHCLRGGSSGGSGSSRSGSIATDEATDEMSEEDETAGDEPAMPSGLVLGLRPLPQEQPPAAEGNAARAVHYTHMSHEALPAASAAAAAAAAAMPPHGTTGQATSGAMHAACGAAAQFWRLRAAIVVAAFRLENQLAAAVCRFSCGRRSGDGGCDAAPCRLLAARIVLVLQLALLAAEVTDLPFASHMKAPGAVQRCASSILSAQSVI